MKTPLKLIGVIFEFLLFPVVMSAQAPGQRLQVVAVRQGALTPNYSNAVLRIGNRYSMTARGINGYIFTDWLVSTNWEGGVPNTNATLNFVMQSNLTVQATFVDRSRPFVTIVSPAANSRTTNAPADVTGTARDNDQVANVWVNVNGAGFVLATTQNGWTNWILPQQPLIAGTNAVQAYAVDASGNLSSTNMRKFFFVVPSTLTLVTNGTGSITRNFSGKMLDVGQAYQVTAVAGTQQVFANWVGTSPQGPGLASTSAKLNFLMQPDLVLQANFIPNPFLAAQGNYNGLFAEAPPEQDSTGFFFLTLTGSGAYSGSLKRGANRYPFAGHFNAFGQATQVVARPGTNAWVLRMGLDFAVQQIAGSVSNSVDGGWVAGLGSDRQVFDAHTNPAPYAGTYTMTIPGTGNDSPDLPGGNGYATLSIPSNGVATVNGSLADGASFSQTVPVPQNGMLPLYAPLYTGGKGSVSGWLAFSNQPNSDFTGVLTWLKPPLSSGSVYTNGFTQQVEAYGLRYTSPARGRRVLNFTYADVVLSGGNLSQSITNQVLLGTNNVVTNLSPNGLTMTVTSSSGLVSGTVMDPATATSIPWKGVVLQGWNLASGYFLGTNQSGSFYWLPGTAR
ncbi:MAG TPA: Ig-like domain-containing protein [Candidatus Acidoferrum sp.]|nr:Ig-like domain-containing protein [Candidatus Acidoferrum sp.]